MNPLQQMLKFLAHLDTIGAGYILSSDGEAVVVLVRTEEGIHEISFLGDGTIEITNFGASGDAESVSFNDLLEGFSGEPQQTH